jgi:hypothetical protein
LFSGDIGGVRIPGFIWIPMLPPELHLEKWRRALNAGDRKIQSLPHGTGSSMTLNGN